MYKQLRRPVAVFLVFSFALQSCIPTLPLSCHVQTQKLPTKDAKCVTLARSTTATQRTDTSCIHNQAIQGFPSLISMQYDLSLRVFTAFSGEQVSFFQKNGFWQAKVKDPWHKISVGQDLPVFFQSGRNSLETLNILANTNTYIHKHRIHVLPMPPGNVSAKYIFLGSLGLLGGMQEPQENKPELQNVLNLHAAVKRGNLRMAEQLLAYLIDANIVDRNGTVPLHWAAARGHLPMVGLLLKHHADPNIADRDGNTPLHWAAEQGHLNVVELLLANHADPNIADRDGNTPLHWAAEQGSLPIVELLLANHADPNIADRDGNTPLHWAAEQGHLNVVELLLASNANPNAVDQNDITPLHWATAKSFPAIVTRLLTHHANPNIEDRPYGYTPLHRAAISGCLESIKLLLQSGASHSQADKDGNTPLHWAASRGHLAVVKLLLAQGADLNVATDIRGYTPLHCAADQGSFETISMLLQAGAKANIQDIDGNTFLHKIVTQRNLDLLVKVIKFSNLLLLSEFKKCIHIIYPKVYEDPTDLLPIIVDYAQAIDWDLKNKQGKAMLDFINIADLTTLQPQAQPIPAEDINTIRKIIMDRVLLEPSLKNLAVTRFEN